MDPRALVKARSRLRTATKAVQELSAIPSGDYYLFCDHWFTFLASTKSVYTALQQGAKASPQSQQWFERKQAERRGDPLVRYMYEARNDEEHGLEPVTEPVPDILGLQPPKEGESHFIKINVSENEISIHSLDGKVVPEVVYTPPNVKLIAVRDRSKNIIQSPDEHLGVKLSNCSPLAVANLYLSYIARLVSEAEATHTT